MNNKRSKRILALLHTKTMAKQQSNKKKENTVDSVTLSRCSSPLQPEAEALLSNHIMRDVWNDAFGDTLDKSDSCVAPVCHDSSPIGHFPSPISEAPKSPSTALTSKDSDQALKEICPSDVIRNDDFMPMEPATPITSADCPISVSSCLQFNINPSTPLTPIFNELNYQQSQLTENTTDHLAVSRTPVPSPVNRHGKCNDPFCCQHEPDELVCPSVSSVCPESNQPSPVATLVRNRGRKRPRNHEEWGDVKRKKLKNLGKKYCSKSGSTVEAKEMGPPCRCRFNCASKITIDDRRQIFEKFWSLGDREKQWLHIANYTKKEDKKRTLMRELKHNRQYTYKYFLPKTNTQTKTHEKIDVCKTMFLNTLKITERMTRTAWAKYDGSTTVEKDMRGRHSNHKKVLNTEMVLSVCAHVNAFVPVESHYCRKNSKRLYLDSSLSIARMFELYKIWPDLANYTTKATSLRQYRDIVNSYFNLSFHNPKKDTCDQCHIFKHTEAPSAEMKLAYEEHQNNKNIARNLKQSDKTEAIESNGIILCATFDFQKVLNCPHAQISVLYYKRKLSCYNFTIFDLASKGGYCYVWNESIAKRGSNEVASCLYNFIKEFSLKGIKELRFWSDNCVGQNKNRAVFAMYSHAAKEFGVTIIHRFLEKGHTQNEGDSVHSVIERAGEHKVIYTPEEWKLVMKWAKSENAYEVIDITTELVYDFKALMKNKNWSKSSNNEKITWTKIREVMIVASHPYKLLYKYDLTKDCSNTLVIRKDTRSYVATALKNAYNGLVAIPKDKFKDLNNLCETGIIPSKYHAYFNSLPNDVAISNDTDNASDSN